MKKPISILVIDDDEDVRQVICDNLKMLGFDIREAVDGQRGLDIIEQNEWVPQCVITDLIMPEKEGFAVIREIRNKNPEIKLIVISGKGTIHSMDYLEMAKKLGADAVYQKPVNMNELEEKIRTLCK